MPKGFALACAGALRERSRLCFGCLAAKGEPGQSLGALSSNAYASRCKPCRHTICSMYSARYFYTIILCSPTL